jgi:acyl-CoA reductase-like NAD-dependent aldehyde dehydrogenase
MTPATATADCCARARAALADWRGRPVAARLRPVRAFRFLVADSTDRLCAAVARDVGKPAAETLGGEVLPLADACRFLECAAVRLLRPRRVPGRLRPLWLWGQRDTVHRRPRGVVGIIGTWNYPLFLNGVQILQALAAGNAVVWKPSELAPASAEVIADLLGRAGFPGRLLHVLEATREAGQALTEGDVDHVVFTGSAATGRHIARRLGERLVSSTLELSGCDPQFVLDDADVPLAARAAWFGATLNRGQTCLAVRRALVQRPAYPTFCAALRDLAAGGAPMTLALAGQAEQARRLVADALARGGRLLDDKSLSLTEGAACAPAVVLNARPDMALWTEASFAPLLAVLPFDGVDEAVRLDAACPYHLGASVFTGDPRRGFDLAAALGSGTVAVNDVVVQIAHPATPFGGTGASGWGVTQGAEGLLEMTVPQVVSARAGRFRPHYDQAPGPATPARLAAHEELVRGLLEAGHAPGWRRRCRGWWRALRALCGSGLRS